MPGRPLRIGVLGLGRIGRIHALNASRHVRGATLIACADPVAEVRADVAQDLGITRLHADYREVLAADDIDAVVAATPTSTHFEVLTACARAGKPIFAEKPIDLDLGRIDEITAEVERRGVPMMVAFQRRYDPDFRRLCDVVRGGGVGDVHLVRITSRDAMMPHESFIPTSGGIFVDMTVHDFDMVRFLTGREVTSVFARGSVKVDPMFGRHGDWDRAVITLTLEGGALATIDNSRLAVYGQDQRAEVFGSRGLAAAANQAVDRVYTADASGYHAARLTSFFPERYKEAYRLELQAFVDAVRSGHAMPVTAADGRAATVIAVAARESASTGTVIALA